MDVVDIKEVGQGTGHSVDSRPCFRDLTHTGRPKGTLENYRALLAFYSIDCRFNVITKEMEILFPGKQFQHDNALNSQLAHVRSLAARHDVPDKNLDAYVLAIAAESPHNPILQWVESRAWDGQDRLQAVFDSLEVVKEDVPWRNVILLRWLMCSIGLLFNERGDLSAEGVLVLQGKQGVGKTRWLQQMGGGMVNDYVASGLTLNPSNRDSVMTATANWMVELGELDGTFAKSELAHLKAFLTAGQDRFRRPYAKADNCYPRRTTFFASVNDPHFLADPTGNRRFWCLSVRCCHVVELDWQQVWAQVLSLLLDQQADGIAHPWRLSAEEQAELTERNAKYMLTDTVQDALIEAFGGQAESSQFIDASARDICNLLSLPEKMAIKVGKALSSMGFEQTRSASRRWRLPYPRGVTAQQLRHLKIKTVSA
ncbi:VapE domain-containing protein [Ferrimonas gelatinilytica]|uniref:Virulence-associated protein E-like domain-containing protein n=1 Tax=Ferrimonas gelatinilytica TaxID=1255257 RepID=A0ABP9RZG1_9GAMM